MTETGTALLISENIPLAPHTTLGVGGPAHFFARARSADQVQEAVDYAQARSCPVFILGRGSNIVVSDKGFPGLVLRIEIPGIQYFKDGNGLRITVGAGVEWDTFVQYCVNRNLAGIECMSGIPGSVGATPIQNVGAYGQEISEVIHGVLVLDRHHNRLEELSLADCCFAYRSSIFNTKRKGRYIILRVDFALIADGKSRIDHQDLQKHFEAHDRAPTIGEVRETVLQIRGSKAMILVDGDPDSRSVGSFFKNPILGPDAAAGLEREARRRGLLSPSESIPRFKESGGSQKLPAAWFVERAGFHKGFKRGRAGISSKHALALINQGGATAQDILGLMQQIQAGVQGLFGIDLQPEPVFVGF